MHGSFSRADTATYAAAIGPDFRQTTIDGVAMSNADFPVTIAHIVGLTLPSHGNLRGRVLAEALRGGGDSVPAVIRTLRSAPSANGLVTELRYQDVGTFRYFDAAGFVGRTVGL